MKERRKIDLFGAITMLVISMAAFYLKNSVGAEMIGLPLESFVYIGIGIFILGLIYTIMETKMQLPYFYFHFRFNLHNNGNKDAASLLLRKKSKWWF